MTLWNVFPSNSAIGGHGHATVVRSTVDGDDDVDVDVVDDVDV